MNPRDETPGGDADAAIGRGLERHRAGDLAGAAARYEEALRLSPGHPQATHLLGVTLAGRGRPGQALPLLEAAAAARPDAGTFQNTLGTCQRALGLNHQAEETFRAALRIDPDDATALCNLGELLAGRDRHLEALTHLQHAARLDPGNGAAVNALAATLVRAGRAEPALAALDRHLRNNPGCAATHHNRATALADLGRIDDSESAALAALAADPDMPAAHWHTGLCRYDARDTDGAIDAFRTAADRAPGFALARACLGLTLAETGQTERGIAELHAAADLDSTMAAMLDGWQSVPEKYRRNDAAGPPGFGFKSSHLRHALDARDGPGLIVELGVYMGRSLRLIAGHIDPSATVHGFDSFEGLPEGWVDGIEGGAYDAAGVLPDLPGNARLHVGWFENSLPLFLAEHPGRLSFANIDCDIYSSTRTFFECFAERIEHGTILVFDEYYCYSGWREHEHKAFREFVDERGLSYEYLALSAITRQATVRIV